MQVVMEHVMSVKSENEAVFVYKTHFHLAHFFITAESVIRV
jgi:hypothetical protein